MDDTISRLAVIQIIEKMRARIGHNLERAVGGAMIEILDEVGEDVGKLPSALGTDLAQLGTDCISRQAAIERFDYIRPRDPMTSDYTHGIDVGIALCKVAIREQPPAQLSTNSAEVGTDAISRQAAISAICNDCGKIDCDKMDKCEKLQLPPANCSEFPNNSDTISRQAAIDICANAIDLWRGQLGEGALIAARDKIKELPSAQPLEDIHREKEQAYYCGYEDGKAAQWDWLKTEIKRMKMTYTICLNHDYYTGYMSALSAVEGCIAQLEGDAE